MTRRIPRLLVAAALAASLGGRTSAQQQAPPATPADQPIFRSSTRLIVTTVTVKDKAGNPVTGLTAKDFVITDFEGEPLHPLSERRLKRSPLRDVAGMIRSFHYAAYSPLTKGEEGIVLRAEDVAPLGAWAQLWYGSVSGCFLAGYFEKADDKLIPKSIEELEILLDAYLLEKAIYELGYELNNRPDWIVIPIKGILDLVGGAS